MREVLRRAYFFPIVRSGDLSEVALESSKEGLFFSIYQIEREPKSAYSSNL